ncbi:amidohydrolase family protein [Moritella sp. 24]|uniref:amidohydrolase family protein n=1 Tax=Moritella sp. 24 TaxID=2746230 RepID=UPI001BA5835E|nr:amidohydrolase family protein [Moritella sp. 24]QUM77852.1 amidohydrolase family protein [Moritella sp. 24]
MRIISDCNFHLPVTPDGVDLQTPEHKALLDHAIDVEFNICKHDVEATLAAAVQRANALGLANANFMILDSDFAKRLDEFGANLKLQDGHYITVLIDPLDSNAEQHIASAKKYGISGIKFHPYLQKITREQYTRVQALAVIAAQCGMWVAVDCSYGTDRLYDINGVELCAFVLKNGFSGRLLALHFGGPKVLDVMSLMAQHQNIYADLSLSLSYWKGSSVWQDLHFSMMRVGYGRFIFGSDQPFIEFQQALADLDIFAAEYGLSTHQLTAILHDNFNSFLGK